MEPCDARLSRKVFLDLKKEALREHLDKRVSFSNEDINEKNKSNIQEENNIFEKNEEVLYEWVCFASPFSFCNLI
jgi:hypothetical protein